MTQVAAESARGSSAPAAEGPISSVRTRSACTVLLLLWMAVCAWEGGQRAGLMVPDFEYFYQGGAWLWNHGGVDPGYDVTGGGQVVARDSLKWYPPFVPRVLTLLMWLPPIAAGRIWFGLNLGALLVTLYLAARYLAGVPRRDWAVATLLPCLLLSVFWHWEFRLNQINNFTLLLLVASFACWRQQHAASAGLWLGLAVLLKVTPLLVLLWFLLKRQFRAVLAAVVTIALAGPAADAIVWGPQEAAERYRAWFAAARDGSQHKLILSQTEMDWRNQGLGAVLSRWLHPTNYELHFDNDPRLRAPGEFATMNVVALSADAVATITTVLQLLSLLGLIWVLRRPPTALSAWQLRAEWCLVLLAMLWFMPVMRSYHLIWALPALVVVVAVWRAGQAPRAWVRWAWLCLLALVPIQLALRWTLPSAAGILLASVVLLAGPVVAMILRPAPERAARSVAAGHG